MRWKYFIPAVVFVAICFVFSVFFLDSILKYAFISGGEMIFGAKVEIAAVKTKFKDLSINISSIKIANRNEPFKNILDVDNVRFAVVPVPLLSKKLIIDEMSIDGMKWGTTRPSSGALPPKKEKKFVKKSAKENKNSMVSKLTDSLKQKTSSEISSLPPADKIREAQKEMKSMSFDKAFSAGDLQSIKEMDTMKNDISQKYTQYDTKLKALNTDQQISTANSAITDITSIKINSVQDIPAAKAKLDTFNAKKDELSKSVSDIQSLQSQMTQDFGTDKDLINKINALKDKDYKAISEKMKLPSFSFGNISQALFGPMWVNRVNQTLYYISVARKYMPPKKKKVKTVNTRMKGSDISFPKEDNPPDFLIKKILISGTTGGPGKEGVPLIFKGVITDVTSDPAQLGRPTRIDIHGTQGSQNLIINGTLDHTTELPVDSLKIVFSGLNATNLGLPTSDYLPDMKNAMGIMSSNFVLKGETVDANMELKISGFSNGVDSGADESKKMLMSLWNGVSEIIVNATMTGKFDSLAFSVSSNIDKLLSDRFKNLLGEQFAQMQNKLKAQIDSLTNAKKDELMSSFTSQKTAALKEVTDKQKDVQSKVDGIQSAKTQKENEIKNQGEAEKKKAEDAATKQATDKLKEFNPFK